ncbi:O-methyltransferase [uncultured Rhodoblastus sp.]|uniref:O-methyltransferase n=1 Tax=uncultured Rhodoblastus sp. TaxID=543037 RepID=UPI0025E67C47|nr:O-methyltransferase [uncultured Rhodoblastus sp.]
MDQPNWNDVDDYIVGRLVPPDSALDAALAANRAAGLPAIDVSPAQGKLLQLFARMVGARKVLEIGTLGGYSTIWLARALPADGLVVTLEALPRHAEVARQNIERAGLSARVEIRVGPALETLPVLAREGGGAFDLVFIDADKRGNPDYLQWAIKLARVGAVIVVDNVVRDGAVLDADSDSADIQGIRRFYDDLAGDARLSATAIQTVGAKGWDGFAIAFVGSQ